MQVRQGLAAHVKGSKSQGQLASSGGKAPVRGQIFVGVLRAQW